MIKLLLIGLLLIYFWYFYFTSSKALPLPISAKPLPPPDAPQLKFLNNNSFQFHINNRVWEYTIPANEPYVIYNNRIIDQNACKVIPDGYSVLATGKMLYDYFRENPLSEDNLKFKDDVQSILHTGQKFYFRCQNGIIDNLHMCPTGTLYSNKIKSCIQIDDCVGQPDDTILRHKTEIDRYISCQNEEPIEKMCPPKQFFMQNRCYYTYNLVNYCKTNTEPFLINDVTKLICYHKKPVLITCPPNKHFFDKDEDCESLDCLGKPNKYKIPLPEKNDGLFRYIPGYYECMNERVSQNATKCLNIQNESLVDLPMVFSEGTCKAPIFCENVFSDDADTIVPISNFTKVLPRWSHSITYDSLRGVTCGKRGAEIEDMPPGYRIKKFKKELACDGSVDVFPIQGHVTQYYDCQTDKVKNCLPNEHFNGSKCVPNQPFSFQHEGIDIFKFDNLKDNWISNWNYSNERRLSCKDPTAPFYLSSYNKCSDRDCAKYPFLTQLTNFSILEKDFKCTFSGTSIIKEPIDYDFTFWNQRLTNNDLAEDKCTPGQLIFTGNFIWDKTIYATCNMDQPFVFCPSSSTQGIELLNGNRYGCKPPDPPYTATQKLTTKPISFNTNEIKSIIPLYPNTEINVDGKGYIILLKELIFAENTKINVAGKINGIDGYVQLVYRYKQSYPPDVHYKEGVGESNENYGAWLIKSKGYTSRPVKIPSHNPEIYIEEYNNQDG